MSELSPGLASGKWGTAVTDIRGYLGPGGGRTSLPCLGHGGLKPAPSHLFPVPFGLWPASSTLPLHQAGEGEELGDDHCSSGPSRSHWTLSSYFNRASKHSITLVEIHVWAAGITFQAWGEGVVLYL